jgi:hypothetical protein
VDSEEKPIVLMAVEPRACREVIGASLTTLRPNLDVRVVEPEDTRGEAMRLHASIVVSSLPPPRAEERNGTTWVRIVFPTEPGTWVGIGDAPLRDRPGFCFKDLLVIVDDLADGHRATLGHPGSDAAGRSSENPRDLAACEKAPST